MCTLNNEMQHRSYVKYVLLKTFIQVDNVKKLHKNFMNKYKYIREKVIGLMRGKSPHSEHVLEKIKLTNYLGNKRIWKDNLIFYYCQISFCRINSRIF